MKSFPSPEETALEYFPHPEEKPARCGAAHYYCLQCNICLAECPDVFVKKPDSTRLAEYIDHTKLNPDTTSNEINELCKQAVDNSFFSVCVSPVFIEMCKDLLAGSKVKVCSVIGFPLGATLTRIKTAETEKAIELAADELDMVMNISWLKEKNIAAVLNETTLAAELCRRKEVVLKCIIETCLLTDEEKVLACLTAKKAGAGFVKTSTGFSKGGAVAADVSLMRQVVGPKFGVKASGGIRDYRQAMAMIAAGANRIGTSSGVSIVSNTE